MTASDAYEYDQLFLTRDQLRSLTETLPTPFYLYDEAGIHSSIRRWQRAFAWNEGYRQVFPLGRLPYDGIADVFLEEGCAVSCQNLKELQGAERCGFRGDRIVYAPLWPTEEGMETAMRLGAAISVDHPAAAAACLEYPVKTVSLCFNPGGKFRAGTAVLVRADGEKRGMTEQQILEYGPYLARAGVQYLGLEAHLSSQTTEPGYYAAVASMLYRLAEQLRRLGTPVAFCNLGGGPGLGFLPGLPDADPDAMSEAVRKISDAWKLPLWSEADRILTGPNAVFVTKVLGVKRAHRTFVIVDADIPQFPRMLQGQLHHISLLSSTAAHGRSYCDVVGWRTDTKARFGERRLLPPVQEHDFCILHNAGVDPPGTGCGCYLWKADGAVVELQSLVG